MKEVTFKLATRAEILEYYKPLVKGKVKYPCHRTGEINDLFELEYQPIEKQINDAIRIGTPIVNIRLIENRAMNEYGSDNVDSYEGFIIQDYSNLKLDREIELLDNPVIRAQRMAAFSQVMKMELDAEQRWDRILKIIDEFKNVDIPFVPNTIL